MKRLLAFDHWVLRSADGIVAWLWTRWGVGRRTILAMLLLGWVATDLAYEIASSGHIGVVNAALYAAVLAFRGVSDHRTPAALTAARRDARLMCHVRLVCWLFAGWDLWSAFIGPATFIGVAAASLFLSYIYAADTLTPNGPPGPKRKERAAVQGPAPVFGR